MLMDNSATYVSWNWKANGSGSSNTDGSINTTATSVNTAAGFAKSTDVGNGIVATVGHGLGVTPAVVLVKNIDACSQLAYVSSRYRSYRIFYIKFK